MIPQHRPEHGMILSEQLGRRDMYSLRSLIGDAFLAALTVVMNLE